MALALRIDVDDGQAVEPDHEVLVQDHDLVVSLGGRGLVVVADNDEFGHKFSFVVMRRATARHGCLSEWE